LIEEALLKKNSSNFRAAFLEHVEIETAAEEQLLDLAAETLGEIAQMRAQVVRDGFTVHGSTGQSVAHPLLDQIRKHQVEFDRLVRRLDPRATPSARQAGAALANKRWAR
jgi:Phage terminase, small subunit